MIELKIEYIKLIMFTHIEYFKKFVESDKIIFCPYIGKGVK